MSQSIGIHLSERRFRLVALECSLKKHKVVCAVSGEIQSGEGAAEEVVERLREIAKEHKLGADSVYLAIDSGVAAFRNLTLPFDDREKIEEVIKFEVEGNPPQFDIEQVVVDFLVLSSKPGVESNLLVTAVPKERLRNALALCEKSGLEALDAELEGTALFDAAFESGALVEEEGTVLIYVGDTSTTVAVADGRRLASLRASRAGAFQPRSGEPEEAVDAPVEAKEGEPAKSAPAKSAASSEPDAARLAATAQRIRRELVRTLSGAQTTSEIRHVFVCGHHLPGLQGEKLLDAEVRVLPFAPSGSALGTEFVVAYGAALRGYEGGTLRPNLRREELRFSGRLERLELPLAVFSLLLFTLLFVQFIVLDKQLQWRDEGTKDSKGDMQIWLEESNARVFADANNPRAVRLPDAPAPLAAYAARAQAGQEAGTKFQQIQTLRNKLKEAVTSVSRDLGQISEIKQPQSALTATTLIMQTIASMGENFRVGIRRYEARFENGQAGKDDYVTVRLDTDFFGANSLEDTQNYNRLETAFKKQPWCMQFEGKSSKPLDNAIVVDNLTIQVNVEKAAAQGGQP